MKTKAGLEEQPLGDSLLVYDKSRDKVFMLNRTAAFIYNRATCGVTEEQIADELKKSFDVDSPGEIRTDIAEALSQMAGDGILVDAGKVEA